MFQLDFQDSDDYFYSDLNLSQSDSDGSADLDYRNGDLGLGNSEIHKKYTKILVINYFLSSDLVLNITKYNLHILLVHYILSQNIYTFMGFTMKIIGLHRIIKRDQE